MLSKKGENIGNVLRDLLGGDNGVIELQKILEAKILVAQDEEEIHYFADLICKAAKNIITPTELVQLKHAMTEVCINFDDRYSKIALKRNMFYSRWLAISSFWKSMPKYRTSL